MNKLEQEFLNSNIEIEKKKDWKQELAEKKFEYQQQKDADKIQEKIMKERAARRQQNVALTFKILWSITKICFWIAVSPILIVGFFFIGFLKALASAK